MKSKPSAKPQSRPTTLNAVFAALWIADTILTLMFTSLHGVAAEANPIMRWQLENFGAMGFIGVKAASLGLWLHVQPHGPKWLPWGLVILMSPVVYLGIRMLFIPI